MVACWWSGTVMLTCSSATMLPRSSAVRLNRRSMAASIPRVRRPIGRTPRKLRLQHLWPEALWVVTSNSGYDSYIDSTPPDYIRSDTNSHQQSVVFGYLSNEVIRLEHV